MRLGKPPFRPAVIRSSHLFVLLVLLVSGTALAQASGTLSNVTGEVRYESTTGSSSWVGVAPVTVERIAWSGEAGSGLRGAFTVAVDAFDSGNRFRDENARLTVFESGTYPEARFRIQAFERVDGEPLGGVPEGASLWQAAGELTLHGVTQPLTVPVTLTRQGSQVTAEASWPVSLAAFDMNAPTFLWLQVQDRVNVSVTLTGVWQDGRP